MLRPTAFRFFGMIPEIIGLTVMLDSCFTRSLRNVENLFDERGIVVSHEMIRILGSRFGPKFAADVRSNRVDRIRVSSHWRRHLEEVVVQIRQTGCGRGHSITKHGAQIDVVRSQSRLHQRGSERVDRHGQKQWSREWRRFNASRVPSATR